MGIWALTIKEGRVHYREADRGRAFLSGRKELANTW